MAHSPLLSIQRAFVPSRLRRCQMVMENANSLGRFSSFLYLIAVLAKRPVNGVLWDENVIYGFFVFSFFFTPTFYFSCCSPEVPAVERLQPAHLPDQARKGTAFGGISDAFYRGQTTFYSQLTWFEILEFAKSAEMSFLRQFKMGLKIHNALFHFGRYVQIRYIYICFYF